jgi:hypothetical protein
MKPKVYPSQVIAAAKAVPKFQRLNSQDLPLFLGG